MKHPKVKIEQLQTSRRGRGYWSTAIAGAASCVLRRLRREQSPIRLSASASAAGLRVHPNMLRHATNFKRANDGIRSPVGVPGSQSITNAVRCADWSPTRFKDLWRWEEKHCATLAGSPIPDAFTSAATVRRCREILRYAHAAPFHASRHP